MKFHTLSQVAAALKIDRQSVEKWVRRGLLAVVKGEVSGYGRGRRGFRYLVTDAELARLVAGRTPPAGYIDHVEAERRLGVGYCGVYLAVRKYGLPAWKPLGTSRTAPWYDGAAVDAVVALRGQRTAEARRRGTLPLAATDREFFAESPPVVVSGVKVAAWAVAELARRRAKLAAGEAGGIGGGGVRPAGGVACGNPARRRADPWATPASSSGRNC